MKTNNQPKLNFQLWPLSWPIFIELFLTFSLGFVDSFFLSKTSDNAAAAVGSLIPLLLLFVSIFQILAQSGASVALQFSGAKKNDKVVPTYAVFVFFNLFTGIFVSIIFYYTHNLMGNWLGLSGEVEEHASTYLILIGSSFFIKATQIAYSSIISANGKTNLNMFNALFSNFCNVILNILFLEAFFLNFLKSEVSGVAIATIFSQVISLIIAIIIVHKKLNITFKYEQILSNFFSVLKPILRIGIPSLLEPISFQFYQIVIITFITVLGNVILATYTYTINIIFFVITWSISIGLGTQLMVAHYVGGKNFQSANKQLRKSLLLGSGGSLVFVLLVFLFSDLLFGIFTQNLQILAVGKSLLLFNFLIEPARASNLIVGSSLRASGDVKYTSIMSIISQWCVGIPTAYILGIYLEYGILGIWVGFLFDEVCRGVLNYFRWKKGVWKRKGVIA